MTTIDGKKVVITYGTFDLFHFGHEALIRRAKQLGDFLIVGVTSDAFDKQRGKMNVRQSLLDRVHAIEETGLADLIVVEEYKGQKIEDIRKYHVDIFAIGSDWVGKFDYLKEYCDVVYLERTKGVSSTELRKSSFQTFGLGLIGEDAYSSRIARECAFVSGMDVTAVYNYDGSNGTSVPGCKKVSSIQEMKDFADIVYIHASPEIRKGLIDEALDNNLHVLCEGTFAYELEDTIALQKKAKERNLVLIEALTARYLPAFQMLQLLLESGIIGEIKDIDASYSLIADDIDYQNPFDSVFYSMLSRTLLPAMTFIGSKPENMQAICAFEHDFCTWVKCNLIYKTASATIKTGRGIKTEGDMVITGTDGYVYIPAPWWRMEYFEVRNEDLRNTKKYYYECSGEGQRYLIKRLYEYCTNPIVYEDDRAFLEEMETSAVKLISMIRSNDCTRLDTNSTRFGGGETVTASA